MKKTIFSGLTVLEPDESIVSDNGAFIGRDRDEIDRALKIGVKTHRHDGTPGLSDPIVAPSAQVLSSGGSIAGDIGLSIGYTLLDLDGGETLLSETTLVTTPAPLEVPLTAPEAAFSSAAGNLMVDTYTYALTYTDGEGGETPVGPSVTADRPPGFASGQIKLSGLTDGLEAALAAGWRLYRARGGGFYVLLAEGGSGEDEFVDDGSVSPDCDEHPPTDNINTTKQTNRIQVTLPSGVGSATFINLYASQTGDFAGNSLLEQYPVASAGAEVTFESLEFADSQPPDVNRSYGGAPKIDPDTELLDWHWKRPVKTIGELPTEDNEEGDVRAILEAEEPTVYMFLNGEWQQLELGGGSNLSVTSVSGDTYIFWTDSGTNNIARANADGSEPDFAFITTPEQPRAVTADDTYVYWVDISGTDKIGRAKLDGTEVNNEFIKFEGTVGISALAVNDTHIYWANSQANVIGRANIDGSEQNNSFISAPENPVDLALDATYIYWADTVATSIGRAKLDGSEPDNSFLTDPTDPRTVAVDDSFIYWVNESGDSIGRAGIDGAEPTNSFITVATDPIGVAVDSDHIYWMDWENDTVGRANIDGTEPNNSFITGLTTPVEIAVSTFDVVVVKPVELIEFVGSGQAVVGVDDLASGGVRVTVDVPEAELLDITASGTTVADARELEFIGSGGINISETEPAADLAEVLIEGDRALLAQEGMGVIVHGADAGVARPNRFKQYIWIGSVEPENMAEFDIWIET